MSMKLLNQAVAVRKGVQSRANDTLKEIYRIFETPDLFRGLVREYKSLADDGETLPSESKKVQYSAEELFNKAVKSLSELIDIEATVDASNSQAKADIKINDTVLAKDVPATTILFLEKELVRFRNDISKLPELETSEEWNRDDTSSLFRSKETATHRTKKVTKPIVKYAATKEHPAQTDLMTEDVIVGHWHTTKISGAMTKSKKEELMDRMNKLIDAVKVAREEANSRDVVQMNIAKGIFEYLLA